MLPQQSQNNGATSQEQTSVDENPYKVNLSEELIKRHETDEPYTIVESEKGIWITIGRHIIKDGYESVEQAKQEISERNISLLVNTMIMVVEWVLADRQKDKIKIALEQIYKHEHKDHDPLMDE